MITLVFFTSLETSNPVFHMNGDLNLWIYMYMDIWGSRYVRNVAVWAPCHRTSKAQTPTFLDPFFFGLASLLSEELDLDDADFDDDEEEDDSSAAS